MYFSLVLVLLTAKRIIINVSPEGLSIGCYYSTHCNTAQTWSWCTEYSSPYTTDILRQNEISCVGEKNIAVRFNSEDNRLYIIVLCVFFGQ